MQWLPRLWLILRGSPFQSSTLRGSPSNNMAWRCSGQCNEDLVRNLQESGLIASERVADAMRRVDRGDFCPSSPYVDRPMGIGYNATISAPHMHAMALEALRDHLVEGNRALDVGSGSGYLTACMAAMVGPSGKVVGIEHIPELVELGERNIKKNHSSYLSTGRVELIEGDGRVGRPIQGGYHAIHVGAAAPSLPPQLCEQLSEGGRMVIPVGTSHQEFLQVDRVNGELHKKVLTGVIYVPLTSRDHQLSRN